MRWFGQRQTMLGRLFAERATLTVFIVNFCIMTLELVAGRMVAPYVGVSLYTWTGVIGVILLGMTIGNYYGGKLADLFPKKELVGYLLLGAGVFSLVTIFVMALLGELLVVPGIPYVASVFLVTSIFLFPSTMLGAVTPVVVKLSLRSLATSGGVVGRIYAAAAAGSILGTYATGFFLISTLGVRAIVVLVTVVLLLVAAGHVNVGEFIGKQLGKKGFLLAFLLGLAALVSLVYRRGACFRESNYYCIKILYDEGNGLKRLALDKLVHSISDIDDPTHIAYDYEKLVAAIVASFPEEPKALFLGGGGYTLPRYLLHRDPDPDLTVVEIDPAVSAVAFAEFDMPRDSAVVTVNMDARMYLANLEPTERFDLIFGDVFSDFSIPYHLTTREFDQMVADHLTDSGFYVVNVIDTLEPGLFLRSFIRTLSSVFPSLILFEPGNNEYGSEGRYTFVVVAGRREMDWEKLRETARSLGYGEEIVKRFSQEELANLVASQRRPLLLTDDYVPADNLIAPVYTVSSPSLFTHFPNLIKMVRAWVE